MPEPNKQVSDGAVFHPGQKVPVSGIYQCDSGCGHRWSTDAKGHRLPPLQDGCTGRGWKLVSKTPSESDNS